jgi:hypothetical protein
VVLPLEGLVEEYKRRSEAEFAAGHLARYVAGKVVIGYAIHIVMFTIFLVQMKLRFQIVVVIDARLLGILVSTALVPQVSRLRQLLRKGHGKAHWGLFRFQFVLLAVVVGLSPLLWLVVLALFHFLHLLPLESSILFPRRPLMLSLHGFELLWHVLRLFMVLVLLVRLSLFLLLPHLVLGWRRIILLLLEWCQATSSSTAWFTRQRYDQVWVTF